MAFRFDNSWIRDMPGSYLRLAPDPAPLPQLVALNLPLAEELGLDPAVLQAEGAAWFSGARLPPGADPVALAYAGHQFGGFSPVLGDGRAHLLGEFLTPDGRRFDLQLKGSGRTPFSRGADGKAGLGPMLREYLISESMAALRVPTTRVLAVATTGETIFRDSGAQTGPQPGAVLARVASSHIRIGSFQFHAARGDIEGLRALGDHAIARHDPELAGLTGPERWLGLFDAVCARQARLIASWMGLGFIHGVMNTDNMTISGETIDYGPCAFMDRFAPGMVFSSIDRMGRYSWANQPLVLAWNLARLAEALLPLFEGEQERYVTVLNDRLDGIAATYAGEWLGVMRAKLGLDGEDADDARLVEDLLVALAGSDWTQFFLHLPGAVAEGFGNLRPGLADPAAIEAWLPRWRARLASDGPLHMARVNPAVIPRNHLVEAALTAATAGDLAPFEALLQAVRQPFQRREAFLLPPPEGLARHVTFCGT